MKVTVQRALYGNVGIGRATCPECGETAFVIHGRMACCDIVVDSQAAKNRPVVRMSQPEHVRRHPSSDDKTRILSEQNHRCFWCGAAFDGVAIRITKRGQRLLKLSPCWDHVEPFAWSQNNSPLNFVAACSICNGIKSSKMFADMEETRAHILKQRERKGWSNLS